MDEAVHGTDKEGHAERASFPSRPPATPVSSAYPPIDATAVLTDDVLYHIFNGTYGSGGVPILPPEWRWAVGMVCRRWRCVLLSATAADAALLHARFYSRSERTLPPRPIDHTVCASSVARMLARGLDVGECARWFGAPRAPSAAAMACVKIASGRRALVAEGLSAADLSGQDANAWRAVHFSMIHGAGGHAWCVHAAGGPMPHGRDAIGRCVALRVALAWIGAIEGRTDGVDLRALLSVTMRDLDWGCFVRAVGYAARQDRADAIAAALSVLLRAGNSLLRRADKFSESVRVAFVELWYSAGAHGSLSVARLLLSIERGSCDSVRLADDREYGSDSVSKSLLRHVRKRCCWPYVWNWIGAAAAGDRTECLDFCAINAVDYDPRYALSQALRSGSVRFCEHLAALVGGDFAPLLGAAMHDCRYRYHGGVIAPAAAAWVVRRCDFEPSEPDMAMALFESHLWDSMPLCDLLDVADAVIDRWPSCAEIVSAWIGRRMRCLLCGREGVSDEERALLLSSRVPERFRQEARDLLCPL
jgi:hypothetical protein